MPPVLPRPTTLSGRSDTAYAALERLCRFDRITLAAMAGSIHLVVNTVHCDPADKTKAYAVCAERKTRAEVRIGHLELCAGLQWIERGWR